MLDWFRKVMLKYRFRRILSQDTREHPNVPSRKLCHVLVEFLNPEEFLAVHPSIQMQVQLEVLYPTIETYTHKLKEINYWIRNQKPVPNELANLKTQAISMDLFFIDESRHYIAMDRALVLFLKQTQLLCEQMLPADEASFGLFEHNLRMLSNVFLNLESILKKLIQTQFA